MTTVPADQLIALVGQLVQRPPGWTDRDLPLIWLAGDRHGQKVLAALAGRLVHDGKYRVPHARVDTQNSGDIRTLLHKACQELLPRRFGGEQIRFERYALLEWLLDQDTSQLDLGASSAVLSKLLRRRHLQRKRRGGDLEAQSQGAAAAFGRAYHHVAALVWWLATAVQWRIAISGRVPGIGRTYRWFMRQQYLAPRQSVDFLGFAGRLAKDVRGPEDPEQIDKLLVHTFLEDLRRAYSRRPWSVEGWRRTAYPVLLVDDVRPGTARYRLLQLINDVRNETGRSDPLLVVCAGSKAPPADGGHEPSKEPAHVEPKKSERKLREGNLGYGKWADALPMSRRARRKSAWYMPVAVSDAGTAGRGAGRPIVPAKPKWFARRLALLAVVAALVVVTGVVVVGPLVSPGCLYRPFAGEVSLQNVDGECVGYSDNAAYLFSDQPGQERLRAVQRRIHQQNQRVRDLWEDGDRRRPLITVVYLGTLTGRSTTNDEEAYAAEREELEGLAVAQYEGMQEPATAYGSALVRVVVANGGFQMRYAALAVEMVADLARRDSTVVAVIGMVESRANTAEAMRRLNQVGLPVLAPTLSADELHENSNLYLQLAPPNRVQAEMFRAYAEQVLGVAEARVYYTVGERSSIDEDLYVNTLLSGIRTEFADRITIDREKRFGHGDSLDHECGYEGMLLFAGRWSEFPSFVRSLEKCNDDPPLHLVADDSVNRYMANPALREGAPDNLALTYVSKSQLGTCEQLSEPNSDQVHRSFLDLVKKDDLLSPRRCNVDSREPVGERVPLAYDGAVLVIKAVERLAARLHDDQSERQWDPDDVNPLAVHAEILGQNEFTPFAGVSGAISFDRSTGEPVAKRISLLQVSSIPDLDAPLVEVFHCGAAGVDDDPECREP